MLDIFASYATDDNAELNGSWQQLGEGSLLIARSGNRNYVRLLTSKVEQNQQLLDKQDDAAEKLSDDIMAEVFAQTILLGWSGIQYQGKDFPYTKENAKKALLHKDFRREVDRLAENVDAYRMKVEGEQVKN